MSAAATAKGAQARADGGVRPAEFRAALDRTLETVAADEKLGPLLAATKMRMRFQFPDLDLVLDLAAVDGTGRLSWSFGGGEDWQPKLELEMDSAVANRYLQGRESLAIAIAHGQARFRGGSRAALVYLPATRLLCEPYRKVVQSTYPDLVAA